MQLQALEPLFKIVNTFVCKKLSSCRLNFPAKIAGKYMENVKQASGENIAQ